jgi:sialate O-acetylesterase
MKTIKAIIFSFFLCIFSWESSYGDIRLPAILSDNMVMQQNARVKLWGWSDPGEDIYISADWLKDTLRTMSGELGGWMVEVITTEAGGPHRIVFKGNNEIIIENILFGEVWLCGGQSNMEWDFRRLKKDPASTIDYAAEQAQADYPGMRFFHVQHAMSDTLQKDCKGRWVVCTPGNVDTFSAVGYYFGRELHGRLHVPVGLIGSYWGGTHAQAWISPEGLGKCNCKDYYLSHDLRDREPPNGNHRLFNAMIHPLLNYRIRGIVWYQGESNRNQHQYYRTLFTALVGDWRELWGGTPFPFYYVQIAPYQYKEPMVGALLREAQFLAMDQFNTGMVVTADVATLHNIHPYNKVEVGKRLAAWALAKEYGMKDTPFSGPLYRTCVFEDDRIRLFFNQASGGLRLQADSITGFMVAGKDRIFHPARVEVEGDEVVVSSPGVKKALAARYAFDNTSTATLFDGDGLPASPFRTDDWPIITEKVELGARVGENPLVREVSMSCVDPAAVIRFTTDSVEPGPSSGLYTAPVAFDKTTTFKARAFVDSIPSVVVTTATFYLSACANKPVAQSFPPDPAYQGGLTDGKRGSDDHADGNWQGFEGTDMVAVIDLGEPMTLKRISAGFLQKTEAWIWLPEFVEYFGSANGKSYASLGRVNSPLAKNDPQAAVKDFTLSLPGSSVRYLKVFAKNMKECPSWHPGSGKKAWIFCDEIIAETSPGSTLPAGKPGSGQ